MNPPRRQAQAAGRVGHGCCHMCRPPRPAPAAPRPVSGSGTGACGRACGWACGRAGGQARPASLTLVAVTKLSVDADLPFPPVLQHVGVVQGWQLCSTWMGGRGRVDGWVGLYGTMWELYRVEALQYMDGWQGVGGGGWGRAKNPNRKPKPTHPP